MHLAIQLLVFWALAFVSLVTSLVFLSIYDSLIGNDLTPKVFAFPLAVVAGFARGL